MSSPIDDNGSNDPVKYAPPWARHQLANDTAATPTEGGPSTESWEPVPSDTPRVWMPPVRPLKVAQSSETTTRVGEPSRSWLRAPARPFEGDRTMRELRMRTALDPYAVPEPPKFKSSRSRWKSVGQSIGISAFAAGVASVVVIYTLPEAKRMALVQDKFAPLMEMIASKTDRVTSLEAKRAEPPSLIVIAKRRVTMNEQVPLGVNLAGGSSSGAVLIGGLAAETQLSAGAAIGSGTWRIPLSDLGQAKVIPPNNFVGTMDITVALLGAEANVADKNVMRIEWVNADSGNRTPASEPRPREEALSSSAPEKRSDRMMLDREEIDGLVERGRNFIANGDLAAARLVLRRAADGGDSQAAFLLGTTFDPVTFQRLHVIGAAPDPTEARNWYQRAAELGLTEAKRRLAPLARGAR
jgi:hypothetical protein